MQIPSILTELQKSFLDAFFRQPIARQFYLTGGTALSEFYLRHRYSEDLDLFTLDEGAFAAAVSSLPALASLLGGTLNEGVATITYRQAFLEVAGEPELRIDLVRDVGPQFGDKTHSGNIIVDSELDIAVNKTTALFGRAATKDFVDLYFLLKRGYDIDELIRLAKQKDTGFSEFYFSGMLRENQRIQNLPRMVQPITVDELQRFFEPLAERIMRNIKPEK